MADFSFPSLQRGSALVGTTGARPVSQKSQSLAVMRFGQVMSLDCGLSIFTGA